MPKVSYRQALHPNLRGPFLYPGVAQAFFIDGRYLPSNYGHLCGAGCPQPCPERWDPQRPPEGLRSGETYRSWNQTLRFLQEKWPNKRINEFQESNLVDFLNGGHHPRT